MKMRRSDKAMTPAEAWEYLKSRTVGRLGLAQGGLPYVVPVNYIVKNDHIYFHSAPVGKKIEWLRLNPRVCFEVDTFHGIEEADKACSFGTYYRSVIVEGTARHLEDPDSKLEILDHLTRVHANGHSYSPPPLEQVERTAVIEIAIESLSGKKCLP